MRNVKKTVSSAHSSALTSHIYTHLCACSRARAVTCAGAAVVGERAQPRR